MAARIAISSVPLHAIIAERWSGRAYERERAVPREDLLAVLEAARWAPSCFGDEPWRYIFWDRFRDPEGWQRALECLAEGNRGWAHRAPVLLAALAGSRFRHNGKANRWAQYDTGAASENLCLQAVARGLMAHQMGGFDPQVLRESFAIPEEFTPMAMISLGYAADPETLEGPLRERETAPRARQPLQACFFEGAWGRAPQTGGEGD